MTNHDPAIDEFNEAIEEYLPECFCPEYRPCTCRHDVAKTAIRSAASKLADARVRTELEHVRELLYQHGVDATKDYLHGRTSDLYPLPADQEAGKCSYEN